MKQIILINRHFTFDDYLSQQAVHMWIDFHDLLHIVARVYTYDNPYAEFVYEEYHWKYVREFLFWNDLVRISIEMSEKLVETPLVNA